MRNDAGTFLIATVDLPQEGDGRGRYRNMTQRAVAPQAQSLCRTEHARHDQCSHQIHLRWFTSSRKRATIQRRISVRDTLLNVSADPRLEQ